MAEQTLSNSMIERLFEEKVLVNDNPEYLDRYAASEFRATFAALDLRYMDFPRLVIILEFARLIRHHQISARRVLMLNGGATGDPELHHLPHDEVEFGDYELDPDRFDMHALDPHRRDYDFVLFSQTLEHLWSPPMALRSLFDVTADGGYVWTSVPTVNCQHVLPYNFTTGFTPIGLACLFRQAGFDVVEIGQWGNRKYLAYLFDIGGWPSFYDLRPGIALRGKTSQEIRRRIARLSIASVIKDGRRNEFDTPVQTWILARKGPGSPS
ncbi:MAG: methyltransferase domain-containing protein [Solirubrobacterales bacterium]